MITELIPNLWEKGKCVAKPRENCGEAPAKIQPTVSHEIIRNFVFLINAKSLLLLNCKVPRS